MASLPPDRLLAIIEVQNEIAATALKLDAVMARILERAQEITTAEASVVEIAEGDEMVYHVARGTAAQYVGLRLRIDSSLSGMCVRDGEVLHCANAEEDDRVNAEACHKVGAMSMLCVPLSHRGRVVGVVKVYDRRAHAFNEHDVETLKLLSGVMAAHMVHASDFELQQHESRHDSLTGLPNRRAFEDRLSGELARLRRHGGKLALCLADLDGFKAVNDSLGHPAGDAVLRAVASHLGQSRGEDTAFRLGGDEFALVLVEADADGARAVLQRIDQTIAADEDTDGVTVSWGIAWFADGDAAASIVGRADVALYDAKQQRAQSGVR